MFTSRANVGGVKNWVHGVFYSSDDLNQAKLWA